MSETCPPAPSPDLTIAGDSLGAIAIEYALLAALVALAIVATLSQLGNNLTNLPLSDIVNAINTVIP